RLRQSVRRRMGQLAGGMATGSRTLFRGSLFAAVGGAIAAVPLVARVVFPGLTAQLGRTAVEIAKRRIPTRLELERHGDERLADGTFVGFSVPEMAGVVRRVLEDIGLKRRFSRLIAVIGHGSTSLNNPHESAYDCGACGGGRGGPNARAFAMMANDPRVRSLLRNDGLSIPDDTFFIGGMQDTCANSVVFFDVERLPESHRRDLADLRDVCDKARMIDAQERCRRFDSVPLNVLPAEALRRVEGRAGDLAQVRPELGHATNAVCIIGRRWRSRGLFLDRRAFLVSYDPADDAAGDILTRTLAAVGPVGSGINLAYLFSRVDPIGYGCGTKLPHNLTGLIGVMDGQASDLRTGLPWQTVEIHEPVRLLLVIDATPERILAAAERLPVVKQLVVNRWVQLASWDPDGGGMSVFENGRFVPYSREVADMAVVQRSAEWYAGHRGNLPPARVLAALGGSGLEGGAA
ncbi:MAG: putative inorganic carbon transporter subunit DabA, partial [Planctomycetota bacterium]